MPNNNFELLLSVINTHSRIIKKLEQRLAPIHGLGLNEFLSLYYLFESESALSRIALADLLGLSASGVTRLLGPIEKLGLIERQANQRDARLSLVKLTSAGREKFADARITLEEVINDIFAKVSAPEKKNILLAMSKIS